MIFHWIIQNGLIRMVMDLVTIQTDVQLRLDILSFHWAAPILMETAMETALMLFQPMLTIGMIQMKMDMEIIQMHL